MHNHLQPSAVTRRQPLTTTRKKRILSVILVINNPEVIIYLKNKTKHLFLCVNSIKQNYKTKLTTTEVLRSQNSKKHIESEIQFKEEWD